MRLPSTLRKQWRYLFGTVVVPLFWAGFFTVVVAALQSVSVEKGIASLERQALAWMLLQRPSRPAHPGVAMVAVDTPLYEERDALAVEPATPPGKRPLASYAPEGCGCPVPRICYALAVTRLHRWGASAVVLDIIFRNAGNTPADVAETGALGAAMQQSGKVIVSAVPDMLALDRSRDPTRTFDAVLAQPTPDIARAAWEVGSPKVDPRDQEYAVELRQTVHGERGGAEDFFSIPWLASCLAKDQFPDDLGRWKGRMVDGTMPRLLGDFFTRAAPQPTSGAGVQPAGGIQLQTTGSVEVDEAFYQKRLLINFAPGADAAVGRYHPARLSWLLSCSDKEGRERFGGKIVLIGNPATDFHATVVGGLPGTEVLANVLQTILEDRPIVPAPGFVVLLVSFGAALLAAVSLRQLPWFGAMAVLALEVGLLGSASLELLKHGTWFLVVTPVTVLAGTTAVIGALQSKAVQGMVARLVPPRMSRMLERAVAYEVEEGTVMFSDIRGYSTFSEYMDPAAIMSQLNAYFSSVQTILDRYDGHFIKSPGDCVVVWFCEEKRGAHHAERAIRAAIELVVNAVRFRKQWPTDAAPFDIGIGINTGPMAVGLLDARRHLEPTLIGDTVNLASRIESLTKQYRATIIVSEETLAPVRDRFLYEPLGETMVKGRAQTVQIFRIMGVAEQAEPVNEKWWSKLSLSAGRKTRFVFSGTDSAEEVDTSAHPLGLEDAAEDALEPLRGEEALAGLAPEEAPRG